MVTGGKDEYCTFLRKDTKILQAERLTLLTPCLHNIIVRTLIATCTPHIVVGLIKDKYWLQYAAEVSEATTCHEDYVCN